MIIALGFVLLVILLVSGVPVVFSFGLTVIMYSMVFGYTPTMLIPTMLGKVSSVVLLAIPFFIMAGGVMEKGKIADVIIDLIELFIGRVKGYLALMSVVACGVFSSICGSGAATLSCIGSIMFPKMKEKNYPMEKAAAVICCSAPLGLLLPPSATQILIAWSGNLSVLACFLSTLVPGLILMVLLTITSYFMFHKEPAILGALENQLEKMSTKAFVKEFRSRTIRAIPALLMPFIILGGIYGGIMTPTEAAGIAVFYAIPVAVWVYKGIKFRELKDVFVATSTMTGVVMVMCVLLMALSHVLILENLPSQILGLFMGISENKYVILFLINVFLILVAMIMDDVSCSMLCTPILLPIIYKIGVNPYHFAAIIGVNVGMGNITPPTAPFLFMSSSLAGVNSAKVAVHNFTLLLFAYLPTLILTTYIPSVALYFPNLILK